MDTNERTVLNVSDIVRYAEPQTGEEDLRFVVIEVNDDRVLLESLNFPQWRIPPREVVALTEVRRVS